ISYPPIFRDEPLFLWGKLQIIGQGTAKYFFAQLCTGQAAQNGLKYKVAVSLQGLAVQKWGYFPLFFASGTVCNFSKFLALSINLFMRVRETEDKIQA
ncbi:hypothetical protein, partial [Acidaminococcus provencensis]|uniref:hypothetical protein n=1 Tax=Acidaminococcus provencensis TaxID=2058289 RepID=UPI0022E76CE7